MAGKKPFGVIYAPQVKDQLRAIEGKHHSLIRGKIEGQLLFEPDVETRNRKPLEQSAAFPGAWELRFGQDNRFRVFYDVEVAEREVRIIAVGVKERDRLFIGGEEVEL
jgi:mRNA-degrading endonuclease RelE of RelBE toxin-antitoxin system